LKGLLSTFKNPSSQKRKRNHNEEKEEGKIEEGALGHLWKKQKSQGQHDFFWSPTKADQKERSDRRQPRDF
jgi:hypothetical protein